MKSKITCKLIQKSRLMLVLVLAAVLILGTLPVGVSIASTSVPSIVRIDNPLPQASALFGRSVAGISDIDGDGTGDLVIGAPGVDRVYLVSGADRSVIRTINDPDDLDGYRFGFVVCGVGDLNDDGVEDVAVGAPGPEDYLPLPCPPGSDEPCYPPGIQGRVFIFSGATGGLILSILPDDLSYLLFGYAVTTLGDINYDGINDIVVGAPVLMPIWGQVYAFSGSNGSQIWNVHEPVNSPTEWFQERASLGAYLAQISDLNGDGVKDLLVAAPWHDYDPDPDQELFAGRAYILDGCSGTILRTHDNPTPTQSAFFGAGLASLGDQDSDGIEDYAVGTANMGIVRLFSGYSGTLIREIESPGDGNTDLFGFSMAKVDDKDGDSLDDFWVNAPMGGTVYLMNRYGDVLTQVNDPNPSALGEEGGFGWKIASTEDLDSDGGQDMILGKPIESVSGFDNAGAVFLVLGVSVNYPPTAGLAWLPECPNEGQQIQFTDASIDDGSVMSWSWTFGDGSISDEQNPSHIYADNDIYTVTLTVTDDGGLTDVVSQDVTINNVAPLVDAGQDQEVYSGDIVTFGGNFTDPGWLDTHTIEWNLGNGSTQTGTLTPTYVYLVAGDYYVTLTVTDDDGGASSDNLTVTVLRIPISIDIKPGNATNSINPKSNGVIPVAILTTNDFDVSAVRVESIRFGPSEVAASHYALEDVDSDEDIDLILFFKTQDTGIRAGNTDATLIGETIEGREILGNDSVRTVPFL